MLRRLLPIVLVAACGGPPEPSTPSMTAASVAPAEVPPPPASAAPSTPAPEELDPGVVVTMSRPTLLRRTLPGGRVTQAGAEVLVVHGDGRVEIRDVDARGLVIASATIDKRRVARLAAVLARPQWATLAPERGTPVPDGPAYTITVNHRSVTRYDNPGDEPVVREAVASLKAIWNDVDR